MWVRSEARERTPVSTLRSDQFLDYGLTLLAESGSGGLSIPALCKGLGVTKGSFYHHFGSLADYTDALLSYWEEERNYRPIERSRQGPSGRERVEALSDWATSLPHDTEAALRAWGNSYPRVAEVTARVDAARVARIRELLLSLGVDAASAEILAHMGVCLLVGFQHQAQPHDPAQLRRMFAEVNTIIYRKATPPLTPATQEPDYD
jgi:AcrR family transcriptional regulator